MRHGSLLAGVVLASASALLGAACGGIPNDRADRQSSETIDGSAASSTSAFTANDVRSYMRQLAPFLVSRELETKELDALDASKFSAIAPMLTAWTKEASFPRAARRLISQKLSVSGSRDGIDFELPGNLAEYVVRKDLPMSTLLTADYCIDANGAKRDCDSGAPFKAGVLTTRAYMASRASRFNLTRASTMMRTFACQSYPMSDKLEPRLPRTRLIPKCQVDEESAEKETFGNGSACYTCHGQFGPHAQLFVRFDQTGMYRPTATGIQDPTGELGRATNGLFASHLLDPNEAKADKSQMLGQSVDTLAEAAKVLAESPTFVPCQVTNVLEYVLRLPPPVTIAPEVLDEITTSAREAGDPTFASIVIQAFSHPRIVASVVTGLGGAR